MKKSQNSPKVKKEKEVAASASPVMANYESKASVSTRSRRNKAGSIERTDKFKNIDDGLIPFTYASSAYGKVKNITIKDAVILCQKAYYNYGIFRHTVDLMTEFSASDIYLRGGSKKSRDFFNALFKKISLWSLQDKFFREYYRSGNVFVYRFDATLDKDGINKITQTFGASRLSDKKLPIKYIILNPADIQAGGNMSFSAGVYYKSINEYELERLRNPRTEEDLEVLHSLPEETQKAIKDKRGAKEILIPLNSERIHATFYKRQDYEPFAVPMGYPVLEDINWKAEMKQMDMAITRTMQQAVLLVTMGAEPDKGGINQKNLQAMQTLFENQSVGRVLIADYTTKAEFIIPKIGDLLDPKKYEIVNQDIAMGLNNMLFGQEKYANATMKIQVFLARLNQARYAFLNEFLIPEIKRIARNIGLKNYPQPYFDEVELMGDPNIRRIYARLIEVGVLTPEEGIKAIDTGRLPNKEESIESQEEYKALRDKGLYEPMMGGPETQKDITDKTHQGSMELQKDQIKSQEKMSKEKAQQVQKSPSSQSSPPKKGTKGPQGESGRPSGTKSPQTTKKPVGKASVEDLYSLHRVKATFLDIEKLNKKVETQLLRTHKLKKLNSTQVQVAEDITKIIASNEDKKDWGVKKVREYLKDPADKNLGRVKEIQAIAFEHQVDEYLATVLYLSKATEDEKKK